MNGSIMVRPAGGAVSDMRDKRLMNAATRYAGRCLQHQIVTCTAADVCNTMTLKHSKIFHYWWNDRN